MQYSQNNLNIEHIMYTVVMTNYPPIYPGMTPESKTLLSSFRTEEEAKQFIDILQKDCPDYKYHIEKWDYKAANFVH